MNKNTQLQKCKGIIFDLDGTLVNSLEDIADAMNTVLKQAGFPLHSYEAYQYFIGNGLRKLVARALPQSSEIQLEIERFYNEMVQVYSKICTNKTKPYSGVFELLKELKDRKIKLSVFSNKSDELTKKITHTIFKDFFDPIHGLTTEILKKPNPSKALEISSFWDLNSDEIFFVGDSEVDMQTATNAKMYAVGVSWGYRTKEEMITDGAKIIIDKPSDLLALLG